MALFYIWERGYSLDIHICITGKYLPVRLSRAELITQVEQFYISKCLKEDCFI